MFDLNNPPDEEYDELHGGTRPGGHHLGLNLQETEEHQEHHQG